MLTSTLKEVQLSNGETIAYREREGGVEVILLVHGNMTSSKHWDILMEAFPSEYKLYAIDMRGFGASSYKTPVTRIKDFSDDMKGLVDSLELKNITLVGWSTGGVVSLQYTIDYPDDVNKVILLASGSTRGYPFMTVNETGEWVRLATLEEVKKDATKSIPIQEAYAKGDKAFLKNIWNMLIYTMNQPSEQQYDEYLEDMMTQRNLTEVYQALNTFNISTVHNGLVEGTGEVEKIKKPILILAGDSDLVISPEMTKEIKEDLGDNGELVYLKGCGHSPLIDDIHQLINNMITFLRKQGE
ncbi:intracellular short-chain-length polyhydroxyalkanoate depolymerase [Bacillus alkalisoli]|uniref:intracellular short-chain-length polyhydroxyalkanoate depolymerase n=1 Tax=Bacillus alkalisoli TaxID=2011008 RepID=UPI000C2354A4|nr:alpha/beta hydrolase [Bacillus alkalisoli]